NGSGVPEHILNRVFDDGFTHGKKNGNGIGLYEAKTKIESWGGSISIVSELDIGTTVIIELNSMKEFTESSRKSIPANKVYFIDNENTMHMVYSKSLREGFNFSNFISYTCPHDFLKSLNTIESGALIVSD